MARVRPGIRSASATPDDDQGGKPADGKFARELLSQARASNQSGGCGMRAGALASLRWPVLEGIRTRRCGQWEQTRH